VWVPRKAAPTAEKSLVPWAGQLRRLERVGLIRPYGIGLVVAALALADVGDVARFGDRNRFASRTGTRVLPLLDS
jgi:hypothetical protein